MHQLARNSANASTYIKPVELSVYIYHIISYW